jgi:hypothetical protein
MTTGMGTRGSEAAAGRLAAVAGPPGAPRTALPAQYSRWAGSGEPGERRSPRRVPRRASAREASGLVRTSLP